MSSNPYIVRIMPQGEKPKSNYIGVSWKKNAKKWCAQMRFAGANHNLGCYDTEAEAARRYDVVARSKRGMEARCNFAPPAVLPRAMQERVKKKDKKERPKKAGPPMPAPMAIRRSRGPLDTESLVDGEKRKSSRRGHEAAAKRAAVFAAGESRLRLSNDNVSGKCTYCPGLLEQIQLRFEHCKKCPQEQERSTARKKASTGRAQFSDGVYHFTRLKKTCMNLCFDAHGNYMYHQKCLQQFFGCGQNFFTNCHKSILAIIANPLVQMRLAEVLELGWEDEVIMPVTEDKKREAYLKSLNEDSIVTVVHQVRSQQVAERGADKRSMTEARDSFRKFIEANRTRVEYPDSLSRMSGTIYYLHPRWAETRSHKADEDAPAATGTAGRRGHSGVLATDVVAQLGLEGITAPSQSRIVQWLTTDYGYHSERGHTVLHPKKEQKHPRKRKRAAEPSAEPSSSTALVVAQEAQEAPAAVRPRLAPNSTGCWGAPHVEQAGGGPSVSDAKPPSVGSTVEVLMWGRYFKGLVKKSDEGGEGSGASFDVLFSRKLGGHGGTMTILPTKHVWRPTYATAYEKKGRGCPVGAHDPNAITEEQRTRPRNRPGPKPGFKAAKKAAHAAVVAAQRYAAEALAAAAASAAIMEAN